MTKVQKLSAVQDNIRTYKRRSKLKIKKIKRKEKKRKEKNMARTKKDAERVLELASRKKPRHSLSR